MEHKLKLARLRLEILRCKLCLIWNKAVLKILLAVKLIVFGKEDGTFCDEHPEEGNGNVGGTADH